jgi:hypothetical protein
MEAREVMIAQNLYTKKAQVGHKIIASYANIVTALSIACKVARAHRTVPSLVLMDSADITHDYHPTLSSLGPQTLVNGIFSNAGPS